jgi:toxin-antitoxin system PIN domain toxin
LANLCDVNLLLALSYGVHQFHGEAKAWLENVGKGQAVTCRVTQMSFLRLLTTTAVLGPDVCHREEAWTQWDALMRDFRFQFAAEPVGLERTLRRLTKDTQVSPKLWQDDYLVAFALSAEMGLATFDRGFARYPGLRTEYPAS